MNDTRQAEDSSVHTAETQSQAYDQRTILLHWLTAFAVVFMWAEAHAIDWFDKGPPRVDARSVHIVVGVLLGMLVAYRLSWRFTGGPRLAYAPAWTGMLARLMHGALYVLIFATVGLGMFNAWVRGDSLFGLARIPPFGSYDAGARHALSESVVSFHSLSANCLLLLAGCHAAVALFHQFVLKDDLITRMLPLGRSSSKRGPGPGAGSLGA